MAIGCPHFQPKHACLPFPLYPHEITSPWLWKSHWIPFLLKSHGIPPYFNGHMKVPWIPIKNSHFITILTILPYKYSILNFPYISLYYSPFFHSTPRRTSPFSTEVQPKETARAPWTGSQLRGPPCRANDRRPWQKLGARGKKGWLLFVGR